MDQITRPKRSNTTEGTPGERTRGRILDTAEDLFAQAGPAAVTLRSIATAADVNVAAVNYHFGSKEKLFADMFTRRIVPLNEERLTRLADCMAGAEGKPTLEAIVAAYVMPALPLTEAGNASARAIVVQYSLGRVLAMPEVNEMLDRFYASVREAFVDALRLALPALAPREIVWRYYWMGGSLMVALAVPSGMVAEDAAADPHRTMLANLIGFLVDGFRGSGSTLAYTA